MKAYKKIMNGLAGIEKFVLIIVSIIVTLITFANVLSRYVFHASFSWSEELVVNLFVLMIMLGCALCARDGSLISLSLVYDRLKAKGKKVFAVIIAVANCAFSIVLFNTGVAKVQSQIHTGAQTFSLRWPQWVFTILLPIGAVFLLIHSIEYCIDVLHMKDEDSSTEKGGND